MKKKLLKFEVISGKIEKKIIKKNKCLKLIVLFTNVGTHLTISVMPGVTSPPLFRNSRL